MLTQVNVCSHFETKIADQAWYLFKSQSTDTRLVSLCADISAPDVVITVSSVNGKIATIRVPYLGHLNDLTKESG